MTSITLTLIEEKNPNDSNSFKQHTWPIYTCL